jgi:hypothetical protein
VSREGRILLLAGEPPRRTIPQGGTAMAEDDAMDLALDAHLEALYEERHDLGDI